MLVLAEYDVVDEWTETDDALEVLGQFDLTFGEDEAFQRKRHIIATTIKIDYQKASLTLLTMLSDYSKARFRRCRRWTGVTAKKKWLIKKQEANAEISLVYTSSTSGGRPDPVQVTRPSSHPFEAISGSNS